MSLPAAPYAKRGAFIVLEGLDRSGKSTQCARLVEQLKKVGIKARLLKFPERTTPIGKMIDAYLQNKAEMDDRAVHLLFSANRWELASNIRQWLAEGTTIIADRYAFSGIAFSAAKGLPYSYCLQPDTGLPAPDLTLLLTLSPAAAAQRGAYGAERYEVPALQARVRDVFAQIGEDVRRRGGVWKEVDASGEVGEVEEKVWDEVQDIVRECERGDWDDVKGLWE